VVNAFVLNLPTLKIRVRTPRLSSQLLHNPIVGTGLIENSPTFVNNDAGDCRQLRQITIISQFLLINSAC